MSDYEYTADHSSPFIAALKQSYRKSLARVHQATLNLHARQRSSGRRSYSDKVCRAIKHVRIFAVLTAGLFVAMVSLHGNETASGHVLAVDSLSTVFILSIVFAGALGPGCSRGCCNDSPVCRAHSQHRHKAMASCPGVPLQIQHFS